MHYLEGTKINALIGMNMVSEINDMLKTTNEQNVPGYWAKYAIDRRCMYDTISEEAQQDIVNAIEKSIEIDGTNQIIRTEQAFWKWQLEHVKTKNPLELNEIRHYFTKKINVTTENYLNPFPHICRMLAVEDYQKQRLETKFQRDGKIQEDAMYYTRLIHNPRTKINEFELE